MMNSKGHVMTVTPTVGMGATEGVGSDCYPATVILVVSPKKIVVRRDNYRRVDNNGAYTESQQYEYSENPSGEETTLTLRKNGRWVPEGLPIKCGVSWHIGDRRAYQDPCF